MTFLIQVYSIISSNLKPYKMLNNNLKDLAYPYISQWNPVSIQLGSIWNFASREFCTHEEYKCRKYTVILNLVKMPILCVTISVSEYSINIFLYCTGKVAQGTVQYYTCILIFVILIYIYILYTVQYKYCILLKESQFTIILWQTNKMNYNWLQ